jgi:hypothetical protein
MAWDAEKSTFFYPCPCGDKFFITLVRTRERDLSITSCSFPPQPSVPPSHFFLFPPLLRAFSPHAYPFPLVAGGPPGRRGYCDLPVLLPQDPRHLRRGGAGEVRGGRGGGEGEGGQGEAGAVSDSLAIGESLRYKAHIWGGITYPPHATPRSRLLFTTPAGSRRPPLPLPLLRPAPPARPARPASASSP